MPASPRITWKDPLIARTSSFNVSLAGPITFSCRFVMLLVVVIPIVYSLCSVEELPILGLIWIDLIGVRIFSLPLHVEGINVGVVGNLCSRSSWTSKVLGRLPAFLECFVFGPEPSQLCGLRRLVSGLLCRTSHSFWRGEVHNCLDHCYGALVCSIFLGNSKCSIQLASAGLLCLVVRAGNLALLLGYFLSKRQGLLRSDPIYCHYFLRQPLSVFISELFKSPLVVLFLGCTKLLLKPCLVCLDFRRLRSSLKGRSLGGFRRNSRNWGFSRG